MIVFKFVLGQSSTLDSMRKLQGSGDLVPVDSWSEVSLTYEKYDTEDLQRNWDKITKSPDGLQSLDKVPKEGTWGILYEN